MNIGEQADVVKNISDLQEELKSAWFTAEVLDGEVNRLNLLVEILESQKLSLESQKLELKAEIVDLKKDNLQLGAEIFSIRSRIKGGRL